MEFLWSTYTGPMATATPKYRVVVGDDGRPYWRGDSLEEALEEARKLSLIRLGKGQVRGTHPEPRIVAKFIDGERIC